MKRGTGVALKTLHSVPSLRPRHSHLYSNTEGETKGGRACGKTEKKDLRGERGKEDEKIRLNITPPALPY